jgi:hypothetical protein
MKQAYSLLILSFFMAIHVAGQVYTNKEVGRKNEALIDSLKTHEYPYVLPIWGAKAAAKGFNLPYSAGININYLWQESSLVINNLQVGFNGSPMVNLDEIVRFNDATAGANAVNIRPDFWLFPFLSVYGILGKAKTSTAIDAGMFVPGPDGVWTEATSFSTTANFDATIMGFGLTPTIGIGGGWMALDMNMAWSDVSALEKPVFTYIFGPRFGKSFKFKEPDRNIAFWVGGFRVNFSSETKGELNLTDIFNTDELQSKVDQGLVNVETKSAQVDEWWNGLTPIEQKNPVNKVKYETANRAIGAASNILEQADEALNDGKDATIQYSLDKNLKDKWNFIVGSQFQLNKHFMLRAEYGFLGSRQQFLTGLQYRFGL